MSKMSKSLVAASVLAATLASGAAMAGASGNIGMVSDYHFRGIDQGSGATASAGLDYDVSGFYVGTWVADVTVGMEYDLYAGYAGELSGFSYDVGYYTYNYTNDAFDDTYKEVMVSLGYGPISASYAKGTYDNFGAEQDYTFASVTAEYKGFYATYGSHGDDFDGTYVELGYGTSIADWDAGVAVISADDTLQPTLNADGDTVGDVSVVFTIGKSFDF
jgi:uncharacterized protein (TIGR02001 family)